VFERLADLVDAMMLFGGQLRDGQDVLRVGRRRHQWAALAWPISTLDLHGIDYSVMVRRDDERLCLTTHPQPFFRIERRRWYPEGGSAITPADLGLCEGKMISWMVASWSRKRKPGSVRLTAPRLSSETANRLARQVSDLLDLPAGVDTSRNSAAVLISGDDRSRAESWLAERVPPAVWRS
jgi:hypothetical protein